LPRKYINSENIQKAENKSKAAWKIVHSVLGRKNNTKTDMDCLYNPEKGEATKVPQELANILNRYYKDIAKKYK